MYWVIMCKCNLYLFIEVALTLYFNKCNFFCTSLLSRRTSSQSGTKIVVMPRRLLRKRLFWEGRERVLISKAVNQHGRTRVKVLSILATSRRAFVRKK